MNENELKWSDVTSLEFDNEFTFEGNAKYVLALFLGNKKYQSEFIPLFTNKEKYYVYEPAGESIYPPEVLAKADTKFKIRLEEGYPFAKHGALYAISILMEFEGDPLVLEEYGFPYKRFINRSFEIGNIDINQTGRESRAVLIFHYYKYDEREFRWVFDRGRNIVREYWRDKIEEWTARQNINAKSKVEISDLGTVVDGVVNGKRKLIESPTIDKESPAYKHMKVYNDVKKYFELGYTEEKIGNLIGFSKSTVHRIKKELGLTKRKIPPP